MFVFGFEKCAGKLSQALRQTFSAADYAASQGQIAAKLWAARKPSVSAEAIAELLRTGQKNSRGGIGEQIAAKLRKVFWRHKDHSMSSAQGIDRNAVSSTVLYKMPDGRNWVTVSKIGRSGLPRDFEIEHAGGTLKHTYKPYKID